MLAIITHVYIFNCSLKVFTACHMLDIILSIEGTMVDEADKSLTFMEPTCYWRRQTTHKKTNK